MQTIALHHPLTAELPTLLLLPGVLSVRWGQRPRPTRLFPGRWHAVTVALAKPEATSLQLQQLNAE
jgi:hypothetical protein